MAKKPGERGQQQKKNENKEGQEPSGHEVVAVGADQLRHLLADCKTEVQRLPVLQQHGRALLMLCKTQEQLFALVEPNCRAFSLDDSVLALTLAVELPLRRPMHVIAQAGIAHMMLRLAWERLEGLAGDGRAGAAWCGWVQMGPQELAGMLWAVAKLRVDNRLWMLHDFVGAVICPNAQVPRNIDAALRRSIPAFNSEVKLVQKALEDIQYQNRIPQRKPWGSMANSLRPALELASARRAELLDGTPPDKLAVANEQADALLKRLQQLELAISTQQPDLTGLRVKEALQAVSGLELVQAPGLAFTLPKGYRGLPRLTGRATVALTVEKSDGALAFVDPVKGGLTQQGRLTLTLDGYSAPLTAGNFADNVLDGLYDGRVLQSSFTSVFVPGKLTSPRPPIPLEILPLGEFDPVYRLPLDTQNGELPVLPLSIYGALSMAHVAGTDGLASGDEWFIFKFEKQQAGLSGLAFDEGTFGVFGYVTDGLDVVKALGNGDVIVRAELVSGLDKLVRPGAAAESG
ncbi:hypothetical protein FOA52_015027 [Chlamydomonas sp. UWO 241]|nr:hypothetical protein FOA52_015027 [Chlamydomonas sp. UWO 241]